MKELEFFKLEDRVLFEAAAVAEIIDAAEAAEFDPNAEVSESDRQAQEEREALKNAPPEQQNPVQEQNILPEPGEIADVDAQIDALIDGDIPEGMTPVIFNSDNVNVSTGRELVVINGSVADKDAIISELNPNQDVLILEDGTGLDELNEFLDAGDVKYSAIHMVTHGNEGYISVNGEIIDVENFDASAWQSIGEHLTADGDILLYGCNTAGNADGQMLVDMISEASDADVAASVDATGISGDWDLEFTSGMIDADEIVVDDFEHNLTNFTVTNSNDSGDGSLRAALEAANNNDGIDEITFDSAVDSNIIKLDSALEITESVNIIGNGADKTIIDGQGQTGIFEYSGFLTENLEISISGMTLQNGYRDVNSTVYEGGAIALNVVAFPSSTYNVSLTLDGVTISNSQAVHGGGIGVTGGNFDFDLDLRNTTMVGNFAQASASGDGGAIYVWTDNFDINVIDSTLTGNYDSYTGNYSGGAVFVKATQNSSINIVNSIVFGNYNLDDSGNKTASDIYAIADGTGVTLNSRIIHSVYGVAAGGTNQSELPISVENSTKLDFTADNMTAVFGTDSPSLDSGNVIQVNNKGIAGYAGTLVAKDSSGNYIYMDTDAAAGAWKNLDGSAAAAPNATDIFMYDELGGERAVAYTYLGVKEFFIGADAGKVYLKVEPQSAEYLYDGSAKSAVVKYTTAGGTELDLSSLPTGTTVTASGITSGINAGDYILDNVDVTISNNGDVTGAFDLDINQNSVIKINKRQVHFASASDSKVYDGTALTNDTVNISGDGFISGEGVTFDVTGSQTDVGTSENTFSYTFNSGTMADNYVVTTGYGTLEVTIGSVITITSGSKTEVYSGNAVTEYSYSMNGSLAAGHELVMAYTGSQTDVGKSENTYTFIVQDALGNNVTANYNINAQNGILEVTKLTLELTVTVNDKIYDGNTAAEISGIVADNMVSGDDLTVKFNSATANFSDKNVGIAKSVTVSGLTLDGSDAGNYDLKLSYTATADIEARQVVVTLNDLLDKTYNGKADDAVNNGYQLSGLNGVADSGVVAGETLSVSVSDPGTYDDKNVGDRTAEFGVSITDNNYVLVDAAGNEITTATANGKIVARKLVVTFDASQADKIYDGTTAVTDSMEVTINGIVENDDVSTSGNWAYDNKNADTGKDVTYSSISLSGSDSGNYTLDGVESVTVNGGIIRPKELTVTVNVPTEKVYDGTTDVDSSASISGVVGGDDVTLNAQWNYNDPDVVDADTISNTIWDLAGKDAGNYSLPDAPFDDVAATITAKDVTVEYVTDAPYYYDSTDQSDTVSAYYTDINGNRVEVPVNWNGKVFASVGAYDITVTVNDPNYSAINPGTTLYMLPNNPAGADYSDGVSNPNYSSVLPGMQGDLTAGGIGGDHPGNIYTMNYNELIRHTMLDYSRYNMDVKFDGRDFELTSVPERSAVDILEFKPMTIDSIVRESVVAEALWTVDAYGLTTGSELFAADGDADALIGIRGDAPVAVPESLYIDGSSAAENLPWQVMPVESMMISQAYDRAVDADAVIPDMPVAVIPDKVEAFKSEFELLLEEITQA